MTEGGWGPSSPYSVTMLPTNARGYSSSSRKYSNILSRLATDVEAGLAARRRCPLTDEPASIDDISIITARMIDMWIKQVRPRTDFRLSFEVMTS